MHENVARWAFNAAHAVENDVIGWLPRCDLKENMPGLFGIPGSVIR